MQLNPDKQPTHKHTHLQAAQSQPTDQSLQKSVLFTNAKPTDTKTDLEKGAADNSSLAKWRVQC